MATTPPTFPSSVASFATNTYNFDPLLADECLSMSAQLSSGQGILKRGQVLCGWTPGTARNVALSTTGSACAILAQDIDTGSAGAVMGLIYTQGKFLVTGMIASGNGMELDSSELWNIGIYVLTVEQRSGLLVPWRSLPATPGVPLPQSLSPEKAKTAIQEEVDAIRAAIDQLPVEIAPLPAAHNDPAWAIAAFGEKESSAAREAYDDAATKTLDIQARQHKALDDLMAKHRGELYVLNKKLREERDAVVREAQAKRAEEDAARAKEDAARAKPLHDYTNPPLHSHPQGMGPTKPHAPDPPHPAPVPPKK